MANIQTYKGEFSFELDKIEFQGKVSTIDKTVSEIEFTNPISETYYNTFKGEIDVEILNKANRQLFYGGGC